MGIRRAPATTYGAYYSMGDGTLKSSLVWDGGFYGYNYAVAHAFPYTAKFNALLGNSWSMITSTQTVDLNDQADSEGNLVLNDLGIGNFYMPTITNGKTSYTWSTRDTQGQILDGAYFTDSWGMGVFDAFEHEAFYGGFTGGNYGYGSYTPYGPSNLTAPFDQWLYDNFVVPYNTEIQYKFNFTASDLGYQLAPADYKKSQLLSHFIKYLFYEVYDKYGEKDASGNAIFMKKYGPRIFHFIGSSAYSPTTGTETLGYASAGVKITLINVNEMREVTNGMTFNQDDIFVLNERQFHTMHHEFSHILHQTKSYPTSFGIVTSGTYDPRSWQERDSCDSHSLGYVTQYGSSANYEDFVETLSCTITDTDGRWMNTIIEGCLNGGVKAGDKEQIYTLIDSLEIENFDDPKMHWNHLHHRRLLQA